MILGIETSCDETAVAVCENGKILFERVYSQIEDHAPYGGIVPEVASREHVRILPTMIKECLEACPSEKISGVAVTNGPGLAGSLFAGAGAAETLSWYLGKPIIPVNHLHAHMVSHELEFKIDFPFLSLLISGGHTIVSMVRDYTEIEYLESTVDDALGELFDKVGKTFGLAYPAGPRIDELGRKGNPKAYAFPLPRRKGKPFLSFSGLKTAIIHFREKYREKEARRAENAESVENGENAESADLFASLQQTALETLLECLRPYTGQKVSGLVISGGVARNSYFRKNLPAAVGMPVHFASLKYCQDNAAMIAYLGEILWKRGLTENAPLSVNPRDLSLFLYKSKTRKKTLKTL